MIFRFSPVIRSSELKELVGLSNREPTTATATKMSLENKHLGNGDYFVNIASSSHPLLLTEHAANRLVTALLK